jgi:para-nitrobenzyl esterase
VKLVFPQNAGAVLIGFLAFLPFGDAAAQSVPVETVIETGTLVGQAENGILSFKGIPYAAPPVGRLRWMPPAPAATWEGSREAKAFGASCTQPLLKSGPANTDFSAGFMSEDCLTLNVWAPEKRDAPLPVMVYIHGGAHVIGSSAQPIYDGANFARSGVVLVTINFRLGNLGYFAHPALTREAAQDAPLGNYAMMDQIAALKWVQRNIAAFGGDPANVTLFGESAGGTNVLFLLAMPSTKGLYEKAIIQSSSRWAVVPELSSKEARGAELASEWGLDGAKATAAELRALPIEKLGVKAPGPNFGPFVDGRLLPESPLQSLLSGRYADVPLIIGYNSDEGTLMELFQLPPAAIFKAYSPDKLAQARELYADEAMEDRLLARRIFIDALFGASSRLVARSTAGGHPSWLYYFSYVGENSRAKLPGAPHGGELIYVFNNFDSLPGATQPSAAITGQDRRMAKIMQGCWVSFAAKGVPECPDAPNWPAYSAASDELMELGPQIVARPHFRKAKVDFQEQNFDPAVLTKR